MSNLHSLKEIPFTSFKNEIIAILEDNLNTPKAVVLIYQKIKDFQESSSLGLALEILEVLKLLSVVGKDNSLHNLYQKWVLTQVAPKKIIDLALLRKEAKINHEWEKADNYRKDINISGWVLKTIKMEILFYKIYKLYN